MLTDDELNMAACFSEAYTKGFNDGCIRGLQRLNNELTYLRCHSTRVSEDMAITYAQRKVVEMIKIFMGKGGDMS